jgi:hypothetical protein
MWTPVSCCQHDTPAVCSIESQISATGCVWVGVACSASIGLRLLRVCDVHMVLLSLPPGLRNLYVTHYMVSKSVVVATTWLMFFFLLQGVRTLTGWPHTQPSKLDCSGQMLPSGLQQVSLQSVLVDCQVPSVLLCCSAGSGSPQAGQRTMPCTACLLG